MQQEAKKEQNYLYLDRVNTELENHHFGVLQKHRDGRIFLFDYSLELVLMNN